MKLEEMKVPELREKAHALGIEGADSMRKAELISAIMAKGAPIDQSKVAEAQASVASESPVSSCTMQSDLAKHPKFAKFKSQGEKHQ